MVRRTSIELAKIEAAAEKAIIESRDLMAQADAISAGR
jgi:hypothetical protein